MPTRFNLFNYNDLKEIATPGTKPAAGMLRMYAKTSMEQICVKNSAGTETCYGAAGSGITSLNSLTAVTQTLTTASTGCTDFRITSATSTHTFCIPNASSSNRGLLTSTDWSTFNAKENALTFNAPLSRATNTISCPTCELTTNKNAANGYAGLDATSRIAKAQAPSTTVYTDASNTFTTGTQDFTAASVTRPFRALAFASFPASCTATKDMLVRTDPATAGQVIYICNASGNGWVLVGDGTGSGAVSSVFGRTGAVVAQTGDYTASQVTNAFDISNFNDLTEVSTPGTSPAAGKLRMYAKTTTEQLCVKNSAGTETCYGTGTGAVTSVFGRTGAVTAQTGDYTAAQVTNAVDTVSAQTINGAKTFTGGVATNSVNGKIYYADQFAGADAVAKINACLAASGSTGICDATALTGAQTGSANIVMPSNGVLKLGQMSLTTSGGIRLAAGSRVVGSGWNATTVSCTTVGGTCVSAIDTTTTYPGGSLEGLSINITGANAIGIDTQALTNFTYSGVQVVGASFDSQTLISCNGTTQDSSYSRYENLNLTTGSSSTNGTTIGIVGACNQNTWKNIRITIHANTDTGVAFNIGGTHLPNGNTFIGGGVEGVPAGTGVAIKEIQSGGGNNFFGFRTEGMNQKLVRASSGSSYGVSLFGAFTENDTTAEVDNGGVLFSNFQTSFGLRPITRGYGIADNAPANLVPNGTMECWTSSTALCGYSGINWNGTSWNLSAPELSQKASSTLTYKNSDGTTVQTSGAYAVKVADATPANAGDGILGPCIKNLDPRKTYTMQALLGANNVGTLIRWGFKFYTDAACATPLTTVSTNALYSTYDLGASGKFSPPAALSYGRTIGPGATFPAHLNGADVAVGNAASTLSPFIAVFRVPVSTPAFSMRPVFVVNTVGGSDDTIYVDNLYIGESWAKNIEQDAPLSAGANGVIGVGLAAPPSGGLCLKTSGTSGLAVETACDAVTSVFGRTGAVAAQTGDYTASQVTNAFDISNFNDLTEVATPGTSPSVGKLRMYAKTSTEQICVKNSGGTETCYGAGGGAVTSVFGRTGAVTAQTGDYTAAQVTNAVSTAPSADQTIQGSADVSFIVKQANVTNTKNPFEVQLKDGTKSFYVDSAGNVHYKGSVIGDGTGVSWQDFTAGTSPGNPATGLCREYVDSTTGLWTFLNPSGGDCLGLSVALSMPSIFNVSGSPVTRSGTLTATLANENANTVFAGPSSGGAAAPTFRALVAADIPAALSATTSVNGTTIPASSTLSSKIASGTASMPTSSIASGACSSAVTVAATGVATTDVIQATPNTDPTAVTGYAPSASGSLYIVAYPTANNVNFKVCNNTAAAITPAALTINWRVAR
jgi:hypothetical protein